MIKIQHLTVDLPGFSLLDVNLAIRENRFFVLLGPTGSGKTVLLEAIAGLKRVTSGRVLIHDRDVTALPPEKRGIGIVYQDCSLFPHLTVTDNINYGLRYHGGETDDARMRFDSLVGVLNIGHLLKRKPGSLSGGELQRVALARALIIEPAVLLLDEPFSAIDPAFRVELQKLLKELQRSSGVTFIMVTHSFSEALSLADSAAIIQNGRIQQEGDMMEIFKKPCSAFVADFVGMKNIFPARFTGTLAEVNGMCIHLGIQPCTERGYIAIRPEDIVLSRSHLDSSIRNSFRGVVEAVTDRGFTFEVNVLSGDIVFRSLVTRGALIDLGIRDGNEIFISFKATAVHNF